MSPAEIENLLPAQGDGHVLITSRSPAWHGVAEVLPVGLLAEASAIDLLLRRTNSSDEKDAAVLATELGRLPLALEQAASYVADQGISLADYLDLYRLRQADLLTRGVPLAYEGTVATVVTLSLENLSSRQPLAVVIIELCALLAPDEIPISSIIQIQAAAFPRRGRAGPGYANRGRGGTHTMWPARLGYWKHFPAAQALSGGLAGPADSSAFSGQGSRYFVYCAQLAGPSVRETFSLLVYSMSACRWDYRRMSYISHQSSAVAAAA